MAKGKIFISYRREDTSGESGRLKDKLEQVFGQENIFYDVETLEAGLNFDQSIAKALDESKVLLAMIGPHWLKVTDQEGKPRILKSQDWVRKEISLALQKNLRVIPVLVNGATMPDSADLPDELQELSLKHAKEISSSRWNYDVSELVKVLEKIIDKKEEPKPQPIPESRPNPRPYVAPTPQQKTWLAKNYLYVLGGIVGLFVLIGLFSQPDEISQESTQEETSGVYTDSTYGGEGDAGESSLTDQPTNIADSGDPRRTNPSGTEIYNSLTLEETILDFSGSWWLYEKDIRSGYFQINQSGSKFSFVYYLFDTKVGAGTGYFENNTLVTETFVLDESPGQYGFMFETQDGGQSWQGQTIANQEVSPAYLVKR